MITAIPSLGGLRFKRRVTADSIRRLFADPAATGGIWDPSYLPGMLATNDTFVDASGGPVGMVLDGRFGYARTALFAPTDQFNLAAAGTSAPTTNTADSYQGRACVSSTFPILASGGFGVSRAQAPSASVAISTPIGSYYEFTWEYAIDRALVAGETLYIYYTGTVGSSVTRLNSTTPVAQWLTQSSPLICGNRVGAGSIYPIIFAVTALGAPVTVYLRQVQATEAPGNHFYQSANGARPVFQVGAGKSFLQFDGVDDYLTAAFPWGTTMDRVSGWRTDTGTVNAHMHGAASSAGGLLLSNSGYVYAYGAAATVPIIATAPDTDIVATEQYTPSGSSLQIGSGAVNTATYSGRAGGTGLFTGASSVGFAFFDNRWYGSIMRADTAAMTVAELALCKQWAAERTGVRL